ncbi:MAG: NAD(P)H-dependent oxidoreductase [Nanoarchaeota archaeon]
MKVWKCPVCGFEHEGASPPHECPVCSSREFQDKSKIKRSEYDGRKFDVLLINASTHRGHNTSFIADLAEAELKKKKASYRRVNLLDFRIDHCWCCYSMEDSACTFPCRNQNDDCPMIHEMMINSRAIIVCSPINWNSMSGRMKVFLDRTTCIQNKILIGEKSLVACKALGMLINGHEDGASKTMMDIFFYFQQMGYILAPFGYAYRTHGSSHNTVDDNKFIKSDKKIRRDIHSVVTNVVETMKIGLETKLKEKLDPVAE